MPNGSSCGHYRYSQLDRPDCMRVLRILEDASPDFLNLTLIDYLPSKRQEQHTVEGLVSISRSDNAYEPGMTIAEQQDLTGLEYVAVSYHWGSDVRIATVYMDGTPFKVTASVSSLLKQLTGEISCYPRSTFFWIDALCINQEDLEEKTLQLPRMRQIFSGAKETLVWLGPASDDGYSDLAMKYSAELASILRDIMGNRPATKDTEAAILEKTSHNPDPRHSHGLYGLGRLLERPWFERVWVIQEVALSNNITVLCGTAKARWDDIATCVMTLFDSGLGVLLGHGGVLKSSSGNAATMRKVQRLLAQDAQGLHLVSMIAGCKSFFASDPRDFILGMLGMVRQQDVQNLTVGYKNTIEEVYQTASELCMGSGLDSQLFPLAGLSLREASSRLRLPSWVPDFSSKLMSRYSIIGSMSATTSMGYHAGYTHEEIGNITAPTFSGSLMSVGGTVLDRVVAVSSTRMGFSDDAADHVRTAQEWVEEVLEMAAEADTNIATTETRLRSQDHARTNWPPLSEHMQESLWRTLCADCQTNGSIPPAEWLINFDIWKDFFLDRTPSNYESMTSLWDNVRHNRAIADDVKRKALQFAGPFGIATRGRRFAVTQQGRFGLVTHDTKVGDGIAVIVGAAVPFVVRKATSAREVEGWLLVGSAYVHGLMYGEALLQVGKEVLVFA